MIGLLILGSTPASAALKPPIEELAALQAMERVRLKLAEDPLQVEGESIPITMTFGIAPVDDDLDSAIHRADAAMYEGKRNGRDRIVIAAPTTTGKSDDEAS